LSNKRPNDSSIFGGRPLVYGKKGELAICGRYLVSTEEEIIETREIIRQINQRYEGWPEHARMKSGEIFPTDVVPVLAWEEDAVHPRLFSWGFPRCRDRVIINAAGKRCGEKNVPPGPFGRRRCIILSHGFYEWKKEPGRRQKRCTAASAGHPSALHGTHLYLYRQEGLELTGFVILTTSASHSCSHSCADAGDLRPDEQNNWLRDEIFARRLSNAKARSWKPKR
jgi:putative SOS response-associated peptidase YedK